MTLSDQYLANALKQIQKATEELKESNDRAEERQREWDKRVEKEKAMLENDAADERYMGGEDSRELFPRGLVKPVGYDRDPQND